MLLFKDASAVPKMESPFEIAPSLRVTVRSVIFSVLSRVPSCIHVCLVNYCYLLCVIRNRQNSVGLCGGGM